MPPATQTQNPIMYSPLQPNGQFPTAVPPVQTPQANPQPQPAAPAPHASWWQKLLPTAGGIVGGVLGDIAVPLVGGVGGAAAGGALGQELENKLTGSKTSTATSAVENGIGSVLGGIGGKALGAVTGKLGDVAGNLSDRLIAGQAPKGAIDPQLANYIRTGLGETNLGKASQIAEQISGGTVQGEQQGGAELSQFVKNNFESNGNPTYDLSKYQMLNTAPKNAAVARSAAAETNGIQQAINENNLFGTPEGKTLETRIQGIMGPGNLGSISNADVLAKQKAVSGLESTARAQGKMDLANGYRAVNQDLKQIMGMDKMPVSQDDLSALADKVEASIKDINPKAASNVKNELLNLRGADGGEPTLADVRSFESKFVTIQKALEAADKQTNANFGTSASDVARSGLGLTGAVAGVGGPKAVAGATVGLGASSKGADPILANILNKAATGSQGKIVKQVLPLATRAATIGALNLPNIASSSTGNPTGANISTGTNTMNPTSSISSGNPFLDAMMTESVLAPNLAGASGAGSYLSALAPTLQKAAMAAPQLQAASQQFGAAGGAGGIGGSGIIDTILSKIPGTPQHAAMSSLQNVSSLLGVQPNMSFLQTPGVAGTQMSALQQILANSGVQQ